LILLCRVRPVPDTLILLRKRFDESMVQVKIERSWKSFVFGKFLLDTRRECSSGMEYRYLRRLRLLDLLELLASRSGQVVTKDEMIRQVWRGDVVTDANLVQHVLLLRKLLGDEYGTTATSLPFKTGLSFCDRTSALPSRQRPTATKHSARSAMGSISSATNA